MSDNDVQANLYSLIRAIRRSFHLLGAAGDRLHADLGITAAMRAVMESLSETGPQSVPGIARQKSVSRQHIQGLVDSLIATGLAQTRDNPAHRRSPLVELTSKGRDSFKAMRGRESRLLKELGRDLASVDVEATIRAVEALNASLAAREAKVKDETHVG